MLPVDLMVELLAQNAFCCQVMIGADRVFSKDHEELRRMIRERLLTLVPPPKLLSECEEKSRHWVWLSNEPRQMYRMADKAYLGDRITLSWMPICSADQVTVIQPVEVNRE